jgi:hypothetical protein
MTNSFRFSEQEHQNMKKLEHFVDWVETLDINNCDEHLQSQQSMVDLDNIDFIGRFENFEQDFKFVANSIKLPVKILHHENKTLDKQVQVTDSLKDRIRQIYQKDYEVFYS